MVGRDDNIRHGVVRSVISVDEQEQSLTFAGDIQQDRTAQLMRTSHEGLINGAGISARNAMADGNNAQPALLVSCIGLKLILRQHTEDEIETVHETLGQHIPKIGFYSHGEFSPHENSGFCDLHNQTMTIALLSEDA